MVLYNGLFRERFASQGGLDSVKSRGTEQRIALDGAVQLAGDHRVEGRPYSVNRNDQNIGPGFQSGLFDGLNRAQGHIIVVRVNRVDLRAAALRGLQERFGDFLPFGAGELARLRLDDLEIGKILQRLLEALLAIDGRRRAGRALKFHHVSLAVEFLREPFPGHFTFHDEVGGDQRRVKRIVRHIHAAVHEDDGNLLRFGPFQDRFPARLNHRREDDGVHALRDKSAERLDLVLLLLLRVGKLEGHAALGRFGSDRLGLRGSPAAFGADLREADRDRFPALFFGAARSGGFSGRALGRRQA